MLNIIEYAKLASHVYQQFPPDKIKPVFCGF